MVSGAAVSQAEAVAIWRRPAWIIRGLLGLMERTMLPLAVAMSVPLFAVILYALLSDPRAGSDHVS
jgi:hypothetical protein